MADAGDAAKDLLQRYEEKLSNVNPRAVGIQLALMIALSLVTIFAFSVLRPRNKLIYAPRSKYSTEEKRPPKIDDGLLSWIGPLRTMKETDMLVDAGLDAVVFLRFLRMCRWLFATVAVVTCGVLIPINLIYNLNNVPSSSRNFLSSLTISNVKGNWLYAHVALSYIICFIAFWFIWSNYKTVVTLRHAYFRSKDYCNSLHARSIMITGIQRQYQSDEGVLSLLTSLNVPYPTTSVHIGRKVGQLAELVEAHNDAVRELEKVLTTYTKNGQLGSKRPTMQVGGFMGIGGQKVDTIDYMTAKIKRFEDKVEQTRDTISDKKSEPYGFASFQAVPYAHVVAKRLQDKKVKGCKFSLAPLPSDIIWKNLSSYHKKKGMGRGLLAILLIVLCGFYTVPLIAVSFLANLAAITQYVGFLDRWSINSQWSFSAFVGIAPPLLSAILQLVLPIIMRSLTSRQGLLTRNQVDRTVLARYWAFLIITQLFIFSLLGVVFNLITELVIEFGKGGNALTTILREVNKLPARINNSYLSQSNYWIGFLAVRAWAAVFDIAQVINLIWVWGRTKAFGRTPREIREWTRPPPFDYAVYIANSLLVVAVALIYAPLAPVVPAIAAITFFISSMLYKYMLIYVQVTEVESGGRMWRLLVNRMLICLVFQQAILVLTIGLQQGWIRSITCVPPVLLIVIFKIALSRTFDEQYDWFNPSEEEVANAVLHKSDERKARLFKRFGNPVLSEPLFTPMIHKASQHLLRDIYSGRMGEDDYVGNYEAGLKAGGGIANADTGGLRFKAIEESDLQQSREAYLREQNAWETGSISTALGAETPFERVDAAQGFFEAKKREYLAHGPGANGGMDRPGTPGSYDLSRAPGHQLPDGAGNGYGVHGAEESQENLLYGAGGMAGRGAGPGYPPAPPAGAMMYSGGAGGNGYQKTAMASYDDVGLAYGSNASGYFHGDGRQRPYDDAQSTYSGRTPAPAYHAPAPRRQGSTAPPPDAYSYPPLPAGASPVQAPHFSPRQGYEGQEYGHDNGGYRTPSPEMARQYSQGSPQHQPYGQGGLPRGAGGHRMYPSSGSQQDLNGFYRQ